MQYTSDGTETCERCSTTQADAEKDEGTLSDCSCMRCGEEFKSCPECSEDLCLYCSSPNS